MAIINIIMGKEQAIRNVATTQDIDMRFAYGKKTVVVDRITAIDYTNAATLLTVGLKLGSGEMILQSEVPAVAGRGITTSSPIYVNTAFKSFMRIVGGTAGDILELFVYGRVLDDEL
jgi:hypothetical protein